MFEPSFEESSDAVIAVLPARPEPRTRPERREKPKEQTRTRTEPNYHVIIWNDEEHTYDYVIEMLMKTFGHPFERAYNITWEVDHHGKGIAHTCHRELAELKCEQVLGYGADPRMQESKGSIRATIEPAPE
jgi:ATP-dependent Clp protease adaptor protein ClpS